MVFVGYDMQSCTVHNKNITSYSVPCNLILCCPFILYMPSHSRPNLLVGWLVDSTTNEWVYFSLLGKIYS